MRLVITDKYWEWDTVEAIRGVDGDTVEVECWVETGYGQKGVSIAHIRLLGIDCPESRSTNEKERAHGLQAKAFTHDIVKTIGISLLRSHYKRSFVRWVGEIWLEDGRYLADVLRENGFEKRLTY